VLDFPLKFVRKIVRQFGFDLIRHHARNSMTGALFQLVQQGFVPGTIIDVGTGTGTEELYCVFPDASYILVEPLVEFEPDLKRLCSRLRGEYIIAAASDRPGCVEINVHEDLFGSSLFREAEGTAVDGQRREVGLITLDGVAVNRQLTPPLLIKVDVQGAELKVLDGASETLERTEVVILETLFFETLIGCPTIADVITYMKNRGFVPYDVFGALYRPLDDALSQVDLLFVRENGSLRKQHGYASAEQRRRQTRNLKRSLGAPSNT